MQNASPRCGRVSFLARVKLSYHVDGVCALHNLTLRSFLPFAAFHRLSSWNTTRWEQYSLSWEWTVQRWTEFFT